MAYHIIYHIISSHYLYAFICYLYLIWSKRQRSTVHLLISNRRPSSSMRAMNAYEVVRPQMFGGTVLRAANRRFWTWVFYRHLWKIMETWSKNRTVFVVLYVLLVLLTVFAVVDLFFSLLASYQNYPATQNMQNTVFFVADHTAAFATCLETAAVKSRTAARSGHHQLIRSPSHACLNRDQIG